MRWDATALLIYLVLVYVWSLWIYPQGRDFAILAAPDSQPFPVNLLIRLELAAFGSHVAGYHAVNLILLYACMLCLYRLTYLVIRGPYWLGALAGALFMANPVHSESVLNLAGAADLVPALLALLAVVLYAENARVAALGAFTLAVLPISDNASLILVLIAYEIFIGCGKNAVKLRRLAPFVLISAVAWLHSDTLTLANLDPAGMFAPMYFIFYPFGFLPENAQRFHAWPVLGWLSAFVIIVLIRLIHRKAQRPAILFGLISMAGFRLFQGTQTIDLVHLIGGGKLLVPNALFAIALVALFHRMMDHPKWRRPLVTLTSLLAVAFFGMELRSIAYWQESGRLVREFQLQAESAGGAVGILPDYIYYGGAPMMLRQSVTHDTPFSKPIAAASLLALNYDPLAKVDITHNGNMISVTVKAPDMLSLLPAEKAMAQDAAVVTVDTADNQVKFEIRPNAPLPAIVTPFNRGIFERVGPFYPSADFAHELPAH
jgi:hypothetical protein